MENKYSIRRTNFKQLLFAAGFSLFSQISIFASNDILFDAMEDKSQFVINEKNENGITKYFNNKGEEMKSNPVYLLSLDERVKKGFTSVVRSNKQTSNKNATGTGPTITVTFLDVANETAYGFDDPTYGAARRATVEKAVEYYASIITNTGTADIEIQESENISGWALASGGQYYFNTPGFQDGTMFRHLTTGLDPSSTMSDGLVTYNFYYTFNDNYNESPTSGEYDLYTVSIHELGHCFGFTSMTEADGSSQLGTGVYSSYDEFLLSDDYSSLFTTIGGSNSAAMFASSSSELITDGVVLDFGTGSYGAVYSPNPFNASSIDHFDSNRLTDGNKYLMNPSLAKGVEIRELHLHEAEVLEKIGYDIDYSTISDIKDNPSKSAVSISMYPNPATSGKFLTVSIHNLSEQNISLTVYDMLGNVVSKQSNSVSPSTKTTQLLINNVISSGVYFVQLQGAETSAKEMFIVE